MLSSIDVTREEVFTVLGGVMDPEVPVLSVVELGIVRDVRIGGGEGGDSPQVVVVITPTYSGCPAMETIAQDITHALHEHGIHRVEIEVALTPAWTTDWLSSASKQKLEAYGIAAPGARSAEPELVPLLAHAPGPRCPLCGSLDTIITSEFGSTACRAIALCRGCDQPFEQFKAI